MTTSAPPKIGFERILVPIDFTDVSERAIEYAKAIARAQDATIALVHVTESISPVTPPEVVWFDQFTGQDGVGRQLEDKGAALTFEGLRATTVVLEGQVQEQILASAEKENADLIVMGTHARLGLSRLLLGSEAESLLRRAACPILVVGPSAQPISAQPWHPRDIVCACNLDPDSASTAAYAHRLAEEFGATFTILHVDDSQGKVSKEAHLARFEFALAPHLIGDRKPNYLWRSLMLGYGLGSTIADLAIERNSSLIVMGARAASPVSTHLAPGIVPQVLAKAPCPVMILHKH